MITALVNVAMNQLSNVSVLAGKTREDKKMVDSDCYRAEGNYGSIHNAVFRRVSLCTVVEKGRSEDIKSTGQEISRHEFQITLQQLIDEVK